MAKYKLTSCIFHPVIFFFTFNHSVCLYATFCARYVFNIFPPKNVLMLSQTLDLMQEAEELGL